MPELVLQPTYIFMSCCPQPPCPSVQLLCNSISASKSKCGFSELNGLVSTPPKFYLTETIIASGNGTGSLGASSYSRTTTYDYRGFPPVCNLPAVCSGNGTRQNGTTPTWIVDGSSGCKWSDNVSSDPSSYQCFAGSHLTTQTSTQTCGHDFESAGGDPTQTCDFCITLSNEYTTATLESNTITALPAYDGVYDDVCTSYRNLSTDETSYTIRRFKYKFKFDGSVTCYLKIYWNETFKPTLTGTVVYNGTTYHAGDEDPDPTHWTCTSKTWTWFGNGNPCGPIPGQESPVYEVLEPSNNGTIYITDIRWSILSSSTANPQTGYSDGQYDPIARTPCGKEQFATLQPNCYPT